MKNILKRELKFNFKSFTIWTITLISLYLIVFLVYPSVVSNLDKEALNEMLKAFPSEMLKAFNMDISSIGSVFGWFKSEGIMIITLIGGLYSAILGISILSKEEANVTIEFLYSKPIVRSEIVTAKIITGFIYITLMVIILYLFNMAGMYLNNDLDFSKFTLLSLTPLFTMYSIFLICMLIGAVSKKTKKILSFGIAFVLFSYFLQIIGNLSSSVKAIKYASVFELTPTRDIILNNSFSIYYVLTFLMIQIVVGYLIYMLYNKKELV